jgi:hypothetical protein
VRAARHGGWRRVSVAELSGPSGSVTQPEEESTVMKSPFRAVSMFVVVTLGIAAIVAPSWGDEQQPENTTVGDPFSTAVTISNGITKRTLVPPRRPGETSYFCNLTTADSQTGEITGGAEMVLFTGEPDSTATIVRGHTIRFTVQINAACDMANALVEIPDGTKVISLQKTMVQLLRTEENSTQ